MSFVKITCLSVLALAGAVAVGCSDDDKKESTGTGGAGTGGAGTGGAGGTASSGGAGNTGNTGNTGGTGGTPTFAPVDCESPAFAGCKANGLDDATCDQYKVCACTECADVVQACDDEPSCRYIMGCVLVSGCNDLTTCMAAMTSHPDECAALGSHLGKGQTPSEAVGTCLGAQGDPGGACALPVPEGGVMDGATDAAMSMDAGDGG